MRKLLLCPPDHYGIEYEINPWMSRARGADTALVQAQWRGLHQKLLSLGNEVHLVPPKPKLPDMVFTANAGLTVGKKFIPSNFRHKERAAEAPLFAAWMEEHGYEIIWLPADQFFEGEGDALFAGDTLFCGYKFRTDVVSHRTIAEILNCLVISVELVDPRFYHIDTCFCPLTDGGAVWFPAAFDEYGQRAIRNHVPNLIDVVEEEAVLEGGVCRELRVDHGGELEGVALNPLGVLARARVLGPERRRERGNRLPVGAFEQASFAANRLA